MLLPIRDYLAKERTASNQQLARFFRMDITALQPLLDIWIKKGVIKRCDTPSNCGSCRGCPKNAIQYYAWVELN